MKNKYSVILGNLGNTRDRFCSGYKTNPDSMTMLTQAAAIPHIKGIELIGTWDIRPENTSEMKKIVSDYGLTVVSIIPDLFSDKLFWKGSFSGADAHVRSHAMDSTRKMCDIAGELNCGLINLWPGQDGYDYLLTTDYEKDRTHIVHAVASLAGEYPDLKFALEYKPKEPRTHSYIARMGDTLLLALETGKKNVGVTIDTGHAFVAGENISEAAVLADRTGNRLFHLHCNDNYTSWDDDMIAGSVHTICWIEFFYWLGQIDYQGWISMDQYPYREDAAGALTESVNWLKRFSETAENNRAQINELLLEGDAVKTSAFLRSVLLK